MKRKHKLVLTAGDPAGVGYEICLKLFTEPSPRFALELAGSNDVELHLVGLASLFVDLAKRSHSQVEVKALKAGCWHMRSLNNPKISATLHAPGMLGAKSLQGLQAGKPSTFAARSALESLRVAFDLVMGFLAAGSPSALITAPVNKKTISLVAPTFTGHTEWLASKTQTKPSMAFLSPVFDLVLMTTHVPIADLSTSITPEVVRRSVERAVELQELTGDRKPIAVMGLNPHAGDDGLLGGEDGMIRRQLKAFMARGLAVEGPLAADSAFRMVVEGRYRTVVASYHDQGLIPLKMLAKGKSTQITMGLPFPRTSVDHGSAYDLAGLGLASVGSLSESLSMAVRLCSGLRLA